MNITTSVSAITSQGESAAVWMQPGSTGDAGKAEVYVYGTDQGIPSSSTIIESGRRIYEPINNTDRAVLSAQNEYWIFYACCKNTGDTAEIVVSYDINYRKNIDVNIQDQTTDVIVFEFFEEQGETTLNANMALFSTQISLTDTTGVIQGTLFHILDLTNQRGMICKATAPATGSIVQIDRQADFAYSAGSIVIRSSTAMNVDATGGARIFGIRTANYDVPEDFDITKIRFACIAGGSTDLSKFGDLTALTKGITIRKKNTDPPYRNLVNFKSNFEMLSNLGSFVPFAGVNPGLSEYGFFSEWKLNGHENHGAVDRVRPGEEVEIVIPQGENLSGLPLFRAVAIGHIVKI